MSQILDNLFVGSLDDAYHSDVPDKVTHILNVAEELHLLDRLNHVYKKIGVEDDDENEDITRIIMQCVEWIEDSVDCGGKVLVHCLEGKSRSVCVCIAYLCLSLGYTFQDAYNLVELKRPCIDVYPMYLQQLEEYIQVHMLMKDVRRKKKSTCKML